MQEHTHQGCHLAFFNVFVLKKLLIVLPFKLTVVLACVEEKEGKLLYSFF